MARGGGALRRARLRPPDDEHGAHRAGVRDRRRPRRRSATSCCRRSRSPGPGMHWVEVSRAIGKTPPEVEPMVEAYEEYHEAAPHRDARRRDRARRPPRGLEGLHRARLPPRPRHRPLDRDDDDRAPADRRGARDGARTGMVLSMHPHAIAADGRRASTCRTRGSSAQTGGESLSRLPMRVFGARTVAGADRAGRARGARTAARSGAQSAGITRARDQERLEQDDPESGVPDQELHGHTCSIDAGSENLIAADG